MSNGNQPSAAPVVGKVKGSDGTTIIGAVIQVQGSLTINSISEAPDGSYTIPANLQTASPSDFPSLGDTLTAGTTSTSFGDDSVTLDSSMLHHGGLLPGWHFKADFTLPRVEDPEENGNGDDNNNGTSGGWFS